MNRAPQIRSEECPRPHFSIRKATERDADGILDCLRSAFEAYRHSYTPDGFRDTVLTHETLNDRLAELSVFVAVTDRDEVIGTIGCKAIGAAGEGHLRGMAVRPGWQGTGVAGELLKVAESELREKRCSRVTLDTTQPLRRAVHFYEKNGFRFSGRVSDFFGMPLHEYVKPLAKMPIQTGNSVHLREAREFELDEMMRQRKAMFQEMGFHEPAALDAVATTSGQYVRDALAAGIYHQWFAVTSDEVVVGGVAVLAHPWVSNPTDTRARRAYILNMYVSPSHRSQGVGRKLVEAAIEWCRREGFVSVFLHASDMGRPLYEKLGFQPTNEMRFELK